MGQMYSRTTFFRKLCEYCGFNDLESAQRFYYALVRMMIAELREKGQVAMPDFGGFRVGKQKSKTMLEVRTRRPILIGERKNVKFEMFGKLRLLLNRNKVL